MMLADFHVEIIPNEPRLMTIVADGVDADAPDASDPIFHPKEPVDVTGRVLLDALGSVNRSAERNLLSFRTGDITLALDDHDGFLTDLFALFTATMRWQLRIIRNGETAFHGILLGLGSLIFDKQMNTLEITAYGPTRILVDTSAETVKRTFGDLLFLVGLAGQKIVGLDSNAGMVAGDRLHITNQVTAEDWTISQLRPSNFIELASSILGTYANSSPVVMLTPWHRYRGLEFLVRALFAVAAIPVAEIRLSDSFFKTLGPSLANPPAANIFSGVWQNDTDFPYEPMCEAITNADHTPLRSPGGTYIQANRVTTGIAHLFQDTPSDDWVDSTNYVALDFSHQFVEGDRPDALLFGWSGAMFSHSSRWRMGIDYPRSVSAGTPATIYLYDVAGNDLDKRTSTTGLGSSWTASALVSAFPEAVTPAEQSAHGCEYDPVRGLVYVYTNNGATTPKSQVYDVAGASWTDLAQSDDTGGERYLGFRYVPDKDYVLCLRSADTLGTTFDICAFRGAVRLWKRSFPACLITLEPTTRPGADTQVLYPTHNARSVSGSTYLVLISDANYQLLWTDDDFQTYTMREINAYDDPPITNAYLGSRVEKTYRIWVPNDGKTLGFYVAAPFFAGVIEAAEYDDQSVSEALADLALISNSIFWVDDHMQGHFVARDLYEPNSERDITDLVQERSDTQLWDQSYQYVEVTGSGEAQRAGSTAFSASGLSLQSALIPNAAFAQALADSYFAFFGKNRKEVEVTISNPSGEVFVPMDRVLIGGQRYLVYESDQDLISDETQLTLLEDV